ncbi:TRAP transporter substrate-binding protein [uncultured Maritimibacter sp.]|jgi:TRAP-type mannitol/chloroaromatic compound transport system substrate-binding protein|uniref:TRAP transporter substrate-binding protein n=1 Tax=uncultured Maritimibacter sp. TaxID=991866 RepID=UPI000B02896A|nr:TRAP transporter substrate-binding protein [uncultured Maritimibacter sp.]
MERRKFLTGAALGTAGAALAAPAIAQGTKTMTIVSTWPRDMPGLGVSAQRLAARITELSEGAITTEYYAAGERVGALDVFDEVANGNSQAYIGADYYWTGKHPGLAYFTAVPFGMTFAEINAWCSFGEGRALWDELQDQFGLYGMPAGNTGTQAGGWFNKEIESADDLKGLKMRIPGQGGQVMSKLGASTVSLPGGQIYENLVSGSIDATEWVGPYNDYFMKFYEAAKYYYTGGMHEPGAQLSLTSNKSWWTSLTDTERSIISAAAAEENAASYYEAVALNGEYLQKLQDEQGVEVRSFNEDVWDAMGEAAMEVFEEAAAFDDLAARINDSMQSAMRQYGRGIALFEGQFIENRNRIFDIG